MRILRAFTLLTACAVWAQRPAESPLNWLDVRTNIQSVMVSLRTLRNTMKPSDAVNTELDKLFAEADEALAAGNSGEARRRLYHGYSLLGGKTWTPKEEFAASLLLRSNTRILDPAEPFTARLEQIYPARYQPKSTLRVKLTLHEPVPARFGPRPGKLVRELGMVEGVSRDLIDEPLVFDATIEGEGTRVIAAELLDGSESVRKLWAAVELVPGLANRRRDIHKRLQAITGHDDVKASILAPFDLARLINLGARDFARSDIEASIGRSDDMLHELEAGRDPISRGPGNHKRHYFFTEAGEIMPYRVYVPRAYKPGSHLPLVLALHGLGGSEDTFLARDNALVPSLAEKYGFIVAAPLGYRPNGSYGNAVRRYSDAARQRVVDLSEKDVMHVLEIVSREYQTDPARTYLMGHSMGGAGAWHLGSKYAEKWAAVAPLAGGTAAPAAFPFDRLKGMPVIVCHGDADATVPVGASRAMVAAMKQRGMAPVYVEVPGASHGGIIEATMPQVFEFFSHQARK